MCYPIVYDEAEASHTTHPSSSNPFSFVVIDLGEGHKARRCRKSDDSATRRVTYPESYVTEILQYTKILIDNCSVQRYVIKRFYMKFVSIQKISGNEVYHTFFLMLLVRIMLCLQFHCHECFQLKPISHKIRADLQGGAALALQAVFFPAKSRFPHKAVVFKSGGRRYLRS